MDIAGPLVDQQPSPQPWVTMRQHVDTKELVRRAIAKHPNASPEELGEVLSKWGYQIPGQLITGVWKDARGENTSPSS